MPVTLEMTPVNQDVFGSKVTRSSVTDSKGFLHFIRLPTGYCTFTVNKDNVVPGWTSYQEATLYYLSGSYSAKIGLMPIMIRCAIDTLQLKIGKCPQLKKRLI